MVGLLSSQDRINLVDSAAGTGKTTMLKAYDEGIRAEREKRHVSGEHDSGGGCVAEGRFRGGNGREVPDERHDASGRQGRPSRRR